MVGELPDGVRARAMGENALALYGERLLAPNG
jgi:hypothetical protein